MKIPEELEPFYRYMSVTKRCSPNTGREYCRDLDRFRREACGKDWKTLKGAKRKRIEKWLDSLQVA